MSQYFHVFVLPDNTHLNYPVPMLVRTQRRPEQIVFSFPDAILLVNEPETKLKQIELELLWKGFVTEPMRATLLESKTVNDS